MATILQSGLDGHTIEIHDIFHEYLWWVNDCLGKYYQIQFDMEATLAGDMLTLDKFVPPDGRLLLAYEGAELAGVLCTKRLYPDTAELKRMYVRPAFRQLGLGRALVQCALAEAAQSGYARIRLDSARYMEEAHRLYRAVGFAEIGPYEGSEIPPEYRHNWVFMERALP